MHWKVKVSTNDRKESRIYLEWHITQRDHTNKSAHWVTLFFENNTSLNKTDPLPSTQTRVLNKHRGRAAFGLGAVVWLRDWPLCFTARTKNYQPTGSFLIPSVFVATSELLALYHKFSFGWSVRSLRFCGHSSAQHVHDWFWWFNTVNEFVSTQPVVFVFVHCQKQFERTLFCGRSTSKTFRFVNWLKNKNPNVY